jgi:hypothetical protein
VEAPAISAVPKARKHTLARRQAAPVYRALIAQGSVGLSWREVYALLHGGEHAVGDQQVHVGQVISWMRSKGVVIDAFYEGGETRFRVVEREQVADE